MENKETFRARIKPCFSPEDRGDIQLAYILAKFGHRAQTRKELVDGKPERYFEHVRRVAIILMDEMQIKEKDMIIAALLHDAFEDTEDITPELVEHSFGKECCTMITMLSKVPKEGYTERLASTDNWKVLALKMCDRLDNLKSLIVEGTSEEFQKKQIRETEIVYFPIFDRALTICPDAYKKKLLHIRDEIRRLVERYKTIIELRNNAPNAAGCVQD